MVTYVSLCQFIVIPGISQKGATSRSDKTAIYTAAFNRGLIK